jgi:hypothetical protein
MYMKLNVTSIKNMPLHQSVSHVYTKLLLLLLFFFFFFLFFLILIFIIIIFFITLGVWANVP